MQINDEWTYRWDSLSHGERKRLQLVVALYKVLFVLAVDEPTNHIDHDVKQILFNALKAFKGIGILVSHDRESCPYILTHE